MSRKPRARSKCGFYHIMLRGNERRNIFHDEKDKCKFIDILTDKKQGSGFYLHAFCLMDNHIHLMLSEGNENVATVIKRIAVSYVSYFNKRYKRVGHLFQDRYKSEMVETDSYALALARYIHQNPVEAGIVKSVGDYKWSSYSYYLEGKSQLVDTDTILGSFSLDTKTALKEFITYMNNEVQEPLIDTIDDKEIMDEESAKELFESMIKKIEGNSLSDKLVKEFREKTNLSIRKIAQITGLNKDKVNKMLRT